MFDCPQCGEETQELHEGYCEPCLEERQLELDKHNAEFDHWESLDDDARAIVIRARAQF